jgi:GTPase SAR1 family protein
MFVCQEISHNQKQKKKMVVNNKNKNEEDAVIIPLGKKEEEKDDGEIHSEITFHPVKNYNVLLIGDSRSGKTTFREYLVDPHHITKNQIFRGTVTPTTTVRLFEDQGQYSTVTIIDCPGFNEVSEDNNSSRSDVKLQSLISSFVKKDITTVNLVMLTVNSTGITSKQLESLTKAVKFLGKAIMHNICMLVTHFETKTLEDETKWINDFKSAESASFLCRAVQAGFLFTGALNEKMHSNIKVRDSFLKCQGRRRHRFFDKLLSTPAVSLRNESIKSYISQLNMQEAIVSKLDVMEKLNREREFQDSKLIGNRIELSTAVENSKVPEELKKQTETLIEQMAQYPIESEQISTEQWKKDRADYVRIGLQVRKHYDQALEHNDNTIKLINASGKLADEINWSW